MNFHLCVRLVSPFKNKLWKIDLSIVTRCSFERRTREKASHCLQRALISPRVFIITEIINEGWRQAARGILRHQQLQWYYGFGACSREKRFLFPPFSFPPLQRASPFCYDFIHQPFERIAPFSPFNSRHPRSSFIYSLRLSAIYKPNHSNTRGVSLNFHLYL